MQYKRMQGVSLDWETVKTVAHETVRHRHETVH